MAGSFTHLHVHTEFSMLDGASRLDPLVAAAAADGQPALGITDHGNMYGVLDFYKECRAQDVKPIIGTEAYMALESREERPSRRGRKVDDSGGDTAELQLSGVKLAGPSVPEPRGDFLPGSCAAPWGAPLALRRGGPHRFSRSVVGPRRILLGGCGPGESSFDPLHLGEGQRSRVAATLQTRVELTAAARVEGVVDTVSETSPHH